MSSRLNRLLNNYANHISVPWQKGLAGVQTHFQTLVAISLRR